MTDAREVFRFDALITAVGEADPKRLADACVVGSSWNVTIRTAEVLGTIRARSPLGTLSETQCLSISIELDRPVPVEPSLRFLLAASADPALTAAGVVSPWRG